MFHFTIESRPPQATSGPRVTVDGDHGPCTLPTLDVPDEQRGRPLSVSFERVAEGLQREPGVFWEPDGSFVWTVHAPEARLEGQLADGASLLQHIELFGTLTEAMMNRLLQLCRADSSAQLMFQLIRTGVYIDEAALRELLSHFESK
jgi:hypothetical protein